MTFLNIAAVPLAVADWFTTRTLGEATLIAVGAVIVGFIVARAWPKGLQPQLFGALVAIAIVGGLAYWGSKGAGLALIVMVALLALMAVAGILW
jgi:hypothetical protein